DEQVGPAYPPADEAFIRTGIFRMGNFLGTEAGLAAGRGSGPRLRPGRQISADEAGAPAGLTGWTLHPAPADQVGRRAPAGLTVGLPISGPGLTMGVGRLSTEVNMAVKAIEREMDGVYLRLAEAAAALRYRQRHYLDGRGAGRLFGPATALTAAHPWALAGFGARAWAD